MSGTNGWQRWPGGREKMALEFPPGNDGDVVQPGGIRDDGLMTLYVGQTGEWKRLAIDLRADQILGVGRGTSLAAARDEALE